MTFIREEFDDYFWELMNVIRDKSHLMTNIDDKESFIADGDRRRRIISFEFVEGIKLRGDDIC